MTITFNDKQKLALTFSYMAYLGFGETGTDRENANKIKGEIDNAIETWPLTKNDWEVVWGPKVYQVEDSTVAMLSGTCNKMST